MIQQIKFYNLYGIYVDIFTWFNLLIWSSFIGQFVYPAGGGGIKGVDGVYNDFSHLITLLEHIKIWFNIQVIIYRLFLLTNLVTLTLAKQLMCHFFFRVFNIIISYSFQKAYIVTHAIFIVNVNKLIINQYNSGVRFYGI